MVAVVLSIQTSPDVVATDLTMKARSLLFVPGDRPERMEKALNSGADAIILDMEDAVAAANKVYARRAIADFLAHDIARPVDMIVRINPLDTNDCVKDIEIIRNDRVAAIMLPKSEGAASVVALLQMLQASMMVLPIAAETPSSLFSLGSYVDVSRYLVGITWGAEDLATAIGAASSRAGDGRFLSPLETARNLTLFAARAADTAAIETVYAKVRDLDGLSAAALRAAAEGFSGMMAIHPSQVSAINSAFSPTEAQIAEAREIVALFNDRPKSGVIMRNGRMLDSPHLIHARAVIARAEWIDRRMTVST